MQRLGKNHGKYFGETLNIQQVLAETEAIASTHGWQSDIFLKTDSYRLPALTRKVARPTKRIYISAGIHGDEPAGPLAVLQLLRENRWPENVDIYLCPCLNPTGFALNTRENANGIDLNRQYLKPEVAEIIAHIAWLDEQPSFDVCVCLHEDWESAGFYLYELNTDHLPSFAQAIVKRVAEVCPIDPSPTIEDRPAVGGIINPNIDPRSRPQWAEAFYLITNKTRLSYTVEAPSDFELKTRIAAEVAAVRAVLDLLDK
jgi:protein MpaA